MADLNYKPAYDRYIQSEEWAYKRQKILERDGYKCVVCKETNNLNVHHLTYVHLGNELPTELVTLCNKCHAAYHSIEKMRYELHAQLEEERQQEYQEIRDKREEEELQKIETQKIIEAEIKQEYECQDYAKNGNIDMCDWGVLKAVISAKCNKYNFDGYIGSKQLQEWFLYRRYEFLLRCIEQGFSLEKVIYGTKFDKNWLVKWYEKPRLQSRLAQEELINSLKEEKHYETS